MRAANFKKVTKLFKKKRNIIIKIINTIAYMITTVVLFYTIHITETLYGFLITSPSRRQIIIIIIKKSPFYFLESTGPLIIKN